jgi:hypothetical protein
MPAYLRLLSALFLMTALSTAQTGSRSSYPDAAQLASLQARFAPTPLRVDTAPLSPGDRQALAKLIEAARIIDNIFLDQYWSGTRALHQQLQSDATPLGRARLRFFWTNKGPWDELGENKSFLPGTPARKLPGANFYPADMSKSEFEQWLKTQPDARSQAESFFTVIHRGSDRRLNAVPYSDAYRADLTRAAVLLREAASLTGNASLRRLPPVRARLARVATPGSGSAGWPTSWRRRAQTPTVPAMTAPRRAAFGYAPQW